jgi:hypothetical protein
VKAEPKKSGVSATGIKCADCPAMHEFFQPTNAQRSFVGGLVVALMELFRLYGNRWSREQGAWRCWDCTYRRRMVRPS